MFTESLSANTAKALAVLGVSTDTEAVDEALNRILMNTKLRDAHKKLAGRLKIKDMDQSCFNSNWPASPKSPFKTRGL